MQIYEDFEGPPNITRSTTAPKGYKAKEKRDERTGERDGCISSCSQNKVSGAVSNSRVPLAPSNPNRVNSEGFCMNLGCSSSSAQSSPSNSGKDSCILSSTVPHHGKRRPLPKFSENHTNQSERVAPQSPLVGQKDDFKTDRLQMRTPKISNQSIVHRNLTPRQRNLRNFISERRNRRVMEDRKTDFDQEEEVSYRNTGSAPGSQTIDSGTINVATPKSEPTIETHDEDEFSYASQPLLGRDICVPLTPPDEDVSVGQFSAKSDGSSIATADTNSMGGGSVGLNGTRLPVLYLGSYLQSLWLDFGDESFNVVGRPRSIPFQLRAPDDTVADGSSFTSSVYVGDTFCIVKIEKVPVEKGFSLNFLEPCDENTFREDESEDPKRFTIDGGGSRMLTLTWTPIEPGNMRQVVYLKLRRGRVRIIAHGRARAVKQKNMAKVRTQKQQGKTAKQIQHALSREHLSNASKKDNSSPLGFESSCKKEWQKKGVHTDATSKKSTRSIKSTRSSTSDFSDALKENDSLSLGFDSSYKKELRKRAIKTSAASIKSARSLTSARSTKSNSKSLRSYTSTVNDGWADRQCNTYQGWLNFLFRQKDGMSETDSMLELESASPNVQTSLRNLLLQRQGAHTRQLGISFYRDADMLAIRNAIEVDVDSKRLCFRTDPYVLANVTLKNRLVSLLLSYSLPWLRFGLETIFAETITSSETQQAGDDSSDAKRYTSKKTTIKALLKKFILERVLVDPDIKAKYTHGKCMMPSGRFEVMYKNEMSQVVLKRILLLVVFLDHAKTRNIIYPSPCLFRNDAVPKSSKDFLELLCKDYVHGIGNLSKHLALIGISVSYTQSHIEELDYSITNMAVDLRDGTRLAKLAEVLCGDSKSSILERLRLPAVSRLQKVHNMKVVLAAFSTLSIPNIEFVQPEHIVDSHRPQVLQFLWSIISHFNLSILLDTVKLKLEIDAVHRTNMCKTNRNNKLPQYDLSVYIENSYKEHNDELSILLLQWCKVVCWSYEVEVANFSKSFSDGKVICCLINFYHPSMLQRHEILPTVSDMFDYEVDVDSIKKDPLLYQTYRHALENERHNSALGNTRIKEIGGIPNLLPISDSTSLPDERSTIISIAYLCSRLIESSTEIISSILIQRSFRKHKNKKLDKEKNAVFEGPKLRATEEFVHNRAASKIQGIYRTWRQGKDLSTTCSPVVVIQKVWRGYSLRLYFYISTRMAILLQKTIRMKLATLVVSKRKEMIVRIQCMARRYIASRKLLQSQIVKYHNDRLNASANQIQALYRGCKVRINNNQLVASVVVIQTAWRVFSTEFIYKMEVSYIIVIQSLVRGLIGRKDFRKKKNAVPRIQKTCRAYLTRKAYEIDLLKHKSSINIQSTFRGYQSLSIFKKAKKGVPLIQALCRGVIVRYRLKSMANGALLMQKIWRGFYAYMQFKTNLSKIVNIQSVARKRFAAASFVERKNSILQIQRAFRRWIAARAAFSLKERLRVEAIAHKAVIVCQAYTRRWIVCKGIRQHNRCWDAASLIQRNWRCCARISNYKLVLQSVKIIQKSIRRWIKRRKTRVAVRRNHDYVSQMLRSLRLASTRSVERRHNAATIIQKYWRGYVTNADYIITIFAIIKLQTFVKKYLTSVRSIKLIQSYMRGSLARKYASKQIKCALVIQCWWKSKVYRLKHQQASTEINILTRGSTSKEDLQIKHKSACQIQRSWRGYRANTNFMLLMLSMIKVQSLWREVLTKKKRNSPVNQSVIHGSNLFFKNKAGSISVLRSVYPNFLRNSNLWLVVEIQKRWRGRLATKKFQKVLKGFIYVQSLVRGQCVRRFASRKMTDVAKRVAIANIDANADPKMVLGSRTSRALLILQRSQRLTEIMDAIRTLEISTSLSPNCCVRFTAAGAHVILYNLIRSCNRSLPHVELLQFILMTLSNVSNYPALVSKIATSESIDILLDLIQMFRDKDTIFCLASTLLEVLALSEDLYKVQCQKRENLKRISGVHSLCVKKLSVIRNKPTGPKKINFSKEISKEMRAGIRALKHILLKTSMYGKGGV